MKNIASNDLFDKDFRKQLRQNPSLAFDNNDKEIKVFTNTKHILYIVFPAEELLENIQNLQAGVKASSVGSISSAGTLGTVGTAVMSTVSTVLSVGSVGTVGSATGF